MCVFCDKKHRMRDCASFLEESVEKKQAFVRENGHCWRCLVKVIFLKIVKKPIIVQGVGENILLHFMSGMNKGSFSDLNKFLHQQVQLLYIMV